MDGYATDSDCLMAQQFIDGVWVDSRPTPVSGEDIKRLEDKVDKVLEFLEELRPFLDMARQYTQGSKLDRARMVIKNVR